MPPVVNPFGTKPACVPMSAARYSPPVPERDDRSIPTFVTVATTPEPVGFRSWIIPAVFTPRSAMLAEPLKACPPACAAKPAGVRFSARRSRPRAAIRINFRSPNTELATPPAAVRVLLMMRAARLLFAASSPLALAVASTSLPAAAVAAATPPGALMPPRSPGTINVSVSAAPPPICVPIPRPNSVRSVPMFSARRGSTTLSTTHVGAERSSLTGTATPLLVAVAPPKATRAGWAALMASYTAPRSLTGLSVAYTSQYSASVSRQALGLSSRFARVRSGTLSATSRTPLEGGEIRHPDKPIAHQHVVHVGRVHVVDGSVRRRDELGAARRLILAGVIHRDQISPVPRVGRQLRQERGGRACVRYGIRHRAVRREPEPLQVRAVDLQQPIVPRAVRVRRAYGGRIKPAFLPRQGHEQRHVYRRPSLVCGLLEQRPQRPGQGLRRELRERQAANRERKETHRAATACFAAAWYRPSAMSTWPTTSTTPATCGESVPYTSGDNSTPVTHTRAPSAVLMPLGSLSSQPLSTADGSELAERIPRTVRSPVTA